MLNEKDCCLVVVDVQGKLAQLMHDKETLFKNIRILIQAAKILEIPILWCQQVPSALGETIPEIAELLTDVEPVNKSCFSCCLSDDFNNKLEQIGRKRFDSFDSAQDGNAHHRRFDNAHRRQFDNAHRRQVLLSGIETHVCVYQTAVDLIEKDFEVDVIADAVSSRTPDNKQIGLQRMSAEGARVTCAEMALFEILRTADHLHFKQIAKLVK